MSQGIEFSPLPRHAAFLNVVERFHQEIKKISSKTGKPLEECALILNKLPFSRLPAKIKNTTPEKLFTENDPYLLKQVCEILNHRSKLRHRTSLRSRGSNYNLKLYNYL